MWNDLRDKAVLVVGGTRGIGLATGLELGRAGARVTLTHRWGSADEAELARAFADAGAPPPDVVLADASREEDTQAVLERIRDRHGALEVLVANVAFGPLVRSLDDYRQRSFSSGLAYSAWPLVAYTRLARELCGRYPRYVVGVSSQGAQGLHLNYDLVAASKAVVETLCRYLAHRLAPDGVRVNVVRTRFARTQSFRDTFGADFEAFVDRTAPDLFTAPEVVARAIRGLCSGLMDGVSGQVVDVDGGAAFADCFSRLFRERARNGLSNGEP